MVVYRGMHLFKAVQECVVGCCDTVLKFRTLLNAGIFFLATRAAQIIKEGSQFLFSGMLVITTRSFLFAVKRNFITRVFCRGSFGN
jgi:hypothetical protein